VSVVDAAMKAQTTTSSGAHNLSGAYAQPMRSLYRVTFSVAAYLVWKLKVRGFELVVAMKDAKSD
jgi:hypothetical protein